MKRHQWIRLAVFLIGFAFFLTLPLHQYWVRKYDKGYDILLKVASVSDNDPDRLSFVHEGISAAGKDATDLGLGYVYFDRSEETARCAGVAAKRREIPENTPFLVQRDLKLTADGKSYFIPIQLHYFAENPAEAANLRMQIVKAKSITLEVTVYPNGDYLVKKIRID